MRLLVALLLVAGCGTGDVLVEGSTPDTPYDGPMQVDQDFGDRASVMKRSGAAGLALECEGKPFAGGGADYDSGLATVQGSAGEAYENWIDSDYAGELPREGLRIEREDDHRVLLSYDVGERTKVAVVAFDDIVDWDGDAGWGIEAWAQCDPSELPAAFTDDTWMQVWEDDKGIRVPVTSVMSYQGAEHCDWQDITFLQVGPERRGTTYLRDVDGELADYTRGRFEAVADLPPEATGTGFRRDGQVLWLVPSRDAAYLVSQDDPSDIERWPAAKEPIGCA